VSGSSDRTVRVWNAAPDIQDETLPSPRSIEQFALSVEFSWDGTKIMAATRDFFYVWDTFSGDCISRTRQSEFVRHEMLMGVTSNGWVRSLTRNTICKLPRVTVTVYTIASSAASKESIALGLESGQLLIIRSPSPTGARTYYTTRSTCQRFENCCLATGDYLMLLSALVSVISVYILL